MDEILTIKKGRPSGRPFRYRLIIGNREDFAYNQSLSYVS
jgi:hypothetical protein